MRLSSLAFGETKRKAAILAALFDTYPNVDKASLHVHGSIRTIKFKGSKHQFPVDPSSCIEGNQGNHAAKKRMSGYLL